MTLSEFISECNQRVTEFNTYYSSGMSSDPTNFPNLTLKEDWLEKLLAWLEGIYGAE